jgi:hypothetical protein
MEKHWKTFEFLMVKNISFFIGNFEKEKENFPTFPLYILINFFIRHFTLTTTIAVSYRKSLQANYSSIISRMKARNFYIFRILLTFWKFFLLSLSGITWVSCCLGFFLLVLSEKKFYFLFFWMTNDKMKANSISLRKRIEINSSCFGD